MRAGEFKRQYIREDKLANIAVVVLTQGTFQYERELSDDDIVPNFPLAFVRINSLVQRKPFGEKL